MKRILTVLAMVMVCVLAGLAISQAAPFLVSDPYLPTEVQPIYFSITEGATTIRSNAVATTGGIRLEYDLNAVTVGAHSLNVRACVEDPQWGENCSNAAPFVYTRPATPRSTTNIRLTPTK